jgi:hypothetical protein
VIFLALGVVGFNRAVKVTQAIDSDSALSRGADQ